MALRCLQICLLLFTVGIVHQVYGQYQVIQGTNYDTGDQSRQEVIDQSGNIRGQYSYIDPTGKTVLVRYTAGVNGFQVDNQEPQQPLSYPTTNDIEQTPIQLVRNKYQGQVLFQPNPNNFAPPATQKQFEAYQKALQGEINLSNGPANTITQDYAPAQFPKTLPSPRPFPIRPYRPQFGFVPGNLGFPLFYPNPNRGSEAISTQQNVLNNNYQQNLGPRYPLPQFQVEYARDATPISEEPQDQYRF